MQVFHLGYPKSGSTTIQELLAADPSINYLGKPFRSPEVEHAIRRLLPYADLRQLPRVQLTRLREVLCIEGAVVSDEILSGIGFIHGIATNSLLQTLDNIDLLTGGDYVAHLVLRQPAALIRSYYGQLARVGARLTFDQFCSLVLLRQAHWVFQALNYRAILDSRPCRDGRLKPVLFETLFKDGQLPGFMQSAFGVSLPPETVAALHANRSEDDSVIDFVATRHHPSPAIVVEMPVTEPTLQEYSWIERLPDDERRMHAMLWATHREAALSARRRSHDLLAEAQQALGGSKGRRPVSPIYRELVARVAEMNAGLAAEHPELDFARHAYFDPI